MSLSFGTLKKAAVGAVGLGAVGLFASPALATTTTTYTLSPPSTAVVATLASGTDLSVSTTVLGAPVTATCTAMKLRGKTPAAGLTIRVPTVHTISGCTDQFGSVTAVASGTWKLFFKKSGTAANLIIPQSGLVFTDASSGCSVTAAPSAPAVLAGTYGSGNLTISGATVPTSYSGGACATSPGTATATFTVTLHLNPAVTVTSS